MNSDPLPADLADSFLGYNGGSPALLVTYMILALVVSAICSLLEATLLSTPMTFINNLEQQGVKGAERLKKLKTDVDKSISAILVVNTIANTVGASFVGYEAAKIFNSSGVGAVSGVFTFLVLMLSEIIPKTFGSYYWRSLAVPASALIKGMLFITYPVVWMFRRVTHRISDNTNQTIVSREEVAAMVTTGAEEGVLEKKENKMIQNLLRLDDVTAHQIMTPSSVVTMADEDLNIREFYESEEFGKFSRIPIYNEENDDYVTGYVLKQEILERLAEDKFDCTLKDLKRNILTFQEDESVSNIWEKLLERKEHISVIIDEYGSMRGIVTMEDVIETMLGFEIVDEKDEVVDMQELAKQQWKKVQRDMAEEAAEAAENDDEDVSESEDNAEPNPADDEIENDESQKQEEN